MVREPRAFIALIVLMTVAACSSATPVSTPTASATEAVWPSDTSYGRLFSQVQPDGSVSKEVALQAFSTAIASLPGVPAAPGGPPQDFERADGTFAIDWLLPYIDQLTPEQRAVVDSVLAPSPSAVVVNSPQLIAGRGPIVREPAAPAADAQSKPYTDAIAAAVGTVASRLHRDLQVPTYFDFAPPPQDQPRALAFAFPTRNVVGLDPRCQIRATPLIEGSSQTRINVTMAHEVFHCFQFDVLPGRSAVGARAWIIEGQAEWAGEDVGGPGPDGGDWWSAYLKTPTFSLFAREYDAVGFYEHLAETGTSPWTIFDKMLSTPADSTAAFKATGAVEDNFLDTWASGMRRMEALPAAWYAQGRWTTKAHAPEVIERIRNGDLVPASAETMANFEVSIESHADIVELTFQGHVRMHTDQLEVAQVSTIDLCTNLSTTGCTCPDGTSYDGPPLTPSDGIIYLALTGSISGSSGTIRGRPLSDFCKPPPSNKPVHPVGGTNPCAKGCASSVGDPHLETIDQKEYDFQAAGEYTLLRSPDGSMEMQGRQIPYPDIANTSISTALAWRVAGHRVGMYADQSADTYSLWLDGTQVDPQSVGTTDLGSGAALTALADGVEVAYGDGTIATAVFHGHGFAHALDIQIAPSDTFRAQATGLLGPIADGSDLPALADGSILPASQDRPTQFTQRYQQLAQAWHVTDQTSLFDYKPGETTATFDKPGFPTEDVAFTVEELMQQQGVEEFQKATQQCAGLAADQQLTLKCVFDIMATKDPAYADFYAQVQQFLANGPTTLDGPVIEVTPPPPPTPSTELPAGFVQVATDASLIKGATIGPDGMLYASVLKQDFTAQLASVDTTTGTAGPTVTTTGSGGVFLHDGSLWLSEDDPTGSNHCFLEQFDPHMLTSQARISVGCDISGVQAVPVADGVWWLDRSTSDADGHGAMIRHIDPATNTVDRSVGLPFVNGYLASSSSTVIFGDPGQGNGWYRLLPGATSFVALPVPDQSFGLHPQGEGVWLQPAQRLGATSEAEYFTSSATPDRVISIDGILTGADDLAVYVDPPSGDPDQLIRYPTDGSSPSAVLTGATLTTANGDHDLGYFDNDPLVIANQMVAKLWLVQDWPAEGTTAVIAQAASTPEIRASHAKRQAPSATCIPTRSRILSFRRGNHTESRLIRA